MNLALVAILLVGFVMGELSPEENQYLDNLVDENIVFEYDEMDAEGLSHVVDGSFIEVKVFHLFEKDCVVKEECGYFTHTILKSGEDLVELTAPGDLLPYIPASFKITSEDEANDFEKILDVGFPVFFSSGKEVYQVNNTWIFVREESFGEKTGVMVEVDAEGAILKIEDGEVSE